MVPKRAIILSEGTEHIFCSILTTSIHIHRTTHSFVKAQKRNLILIIFYRKIQTLGVKNTTPLIEMVI